MRSVVKTAWGISSMVAVTAAVTSSGAAPAASAGASSVPAPTPSGGGSSSAPAPAVTNGPGPVSVGVLTETFSFASTGVSAITLASITSGIATEASVALHTDLVATPGATPPISGAPPLPSWSYVPGSFPPLDQVPPTDSPQVAAWIQEVANSGVTIPNIAPTSLGGCSNNTAAAADTTRCWWTCGECTRPSDVTTCPDKLTWGLSYDDGPTPWTPKLLDFMDDNQIKATFFVVGSRCISWPTVLQAEYMAGHQICDHTWSHPYLTTLTNEQVIAELGWTREAIRQILGVSPQFMRPPYGDIDDRVRAIAQAMGMTPIIWTSVNGNDFDTNDWLIPGGELLETVITDYDNILDMAKTIDTGFIVLEHDLYPQTVELAIGYFLPSALAQHTFDLMPIITCMHKPLGDAYLETNNNQSNPFSVNYLPATGSAAIQPTGVGAPSTASTSSSSSASGKKSSATPMLSFDAVKAVGALAAAVVGGAMLVV